jgi:hypothetical protein
MKENSEATACGRPLSECLQTIEAFHGWQAPGLVLGLFKKDLSLDVLLPVILAAGRQVLSSRAVVLTDLYQRSKKAGINICPGCGQAFAARQGEHCLACRGEGYCAPAGDRSGTP